MEDLKIHSKVARKRRKGANIEYLSYVELKGIQRSRNKSLKAT